MLLAAFLAAACRPSPPASQPASQPATAPDRPTFHDTPEGAARRFMYAWLTSDESLIREAIVPNDDYKLLFSLGWSAPEVRQQAIHRALNDPVQEFKPGDAFPVGLPGQPKQVYVVPADGLDEDHRLLMLDERGLMAVRFKGHWRIDANDIIRGFLQSHRFEPPKVAKPTPPSVPATPTTSTADEHR